MSRAKLYAAGAAVMVSAGLLLSPDASAQQPQPQQPGQPGQPGRPIIVRQPNQVPGQPIGPAGQQLQPGMRRPPVRRPTRPGIGTNPAASNHGAEAPGEEHAADHGAAEHAGHCPGHGPLDPPPHINWYQGIAGVDNDKAEHGTGFQKLLYRYKNEENECDPKNQEPPLLAAAFNFAIVIYLLVRLGKGPLKEGLLKRKKTLLQDMEAANELKTNAEERLATYEKQMARIEERRKELQEEYRAQWLTEEKRILNDAADKSARLRKDAEFRIAQELKQSQADLLQEAVDGALAAAEDLMKKRIQASDQTRLADDYLAAVGPALAAAKTTGGRA